MAAHLLILKLTASGTPLPSDTTSIKAERGGLTQDYVTVAGSGNQVAVKFS